jgi:hypothetical protein
MTKEMAAAAVAETETIAVPGTTPKMIPAVMVRGIAGKAKTSKRVYTTP